MNVCITSHGLIFSTKPYSLNINTRLRRSEFLQCASDSFSYLINIPKAIA